MNRDLYRWIALAILVLLFAATAYVYRPVESRLTRITVIGDSQTKVAPDTAVITFSVVTQGKNAVAAQQENASKSAAVEEAVERAAANETEIKTSNYVLSPEQDYSGRVPKIVGYEVRNTVTVTIDDLEIVGPIIDAATSAGANSVEGIRFGVGQASPAQGEALALAAKQAMAKAEAMAASLNGRVVRVVQSTEGGIEPEHVQASYLANSNASMHSFEGTSTPVRAGELDFRSQVILIVDIAI